MKKLGRFRIKLIRSLVRMLDKYLIKQIKVAGLREYAEKQLIHLESLLDRLTDKNPNNTDQLIELWQEIKDDLPGESLEAALLIIQTKVKNPAIVDMILLLLETYMEEEAEKEQAMA